MCTGDDILVGVAAYIHSQFLFHPSETSAWRSVPIRTVYIMCGPDPWTYQMHHMLTGRSYVRRRLLQPFTQLESPSSSSLVLALTRATSRQLNIEILARHRHGAAAAAATASARS